MRELAQQAFAFKQRFAHQADFTMLQVTQSAMDDPGGTAGGAGGEIILLNQQRALAPLGTLTRNGDTVDAAADHQNVKALVARLYRAAHLGLLDAFSEKVQHYFGA